jgi:hypothetical protein
MSAMLKPEPNYAFRRLIDRVHVPGRRNAAAEPQKDEILIAPSWRIVIPRDAGRLVRNVAKDLQDYFLENMDLSLPVVPQADLSPALQENAHAIVLATKRELPEIGKGLSIPKSYRLFCRAGSVIVCGCDDRGAGQGSYFLEDLMNLREAPILNRQDVVRTPLFSPRMVHSGWGPSGFHDSHLNAIAHTGMDAILVFTKGVDHTTQGYCDFNDLIARAETHGIDVYFYSYLKSAKHPDDADAEACYDSTYGALFKACPRAKGVVMVGESVEFPSKDPRTTGRPWNAPYELPPTKPSPGWWPCEDYPQWLRMIQKVVRKHAPQADIVFWTYNWGWAPEAERLRLINAIPADVSLLVTFEMFDQVRREGVTHVCVDYTLSSVGPGAYFRSEAEAARKRGIRLYTMSNTAGATWDFGTAPYEPAPFQWARRHAALKEAREKWGLCGLMESHHYGWWPSFVLELAKWAYWSPGLSADEAAAAIIRRDYGEQALPFVRAAWERWSEAMTFYIPTNEDQYGPFRIGPSYPLIFHPNLSRTFSVKEIKPLSAWHAHFGGQIVTTLYRPFDDPRQSPGASRSEVEVRALQTMGELWRQGIASLEQALAVTPEAKRDTGERLLNLGRFMLSFIDTTIHVKQWWKLNQQLILDPDPAAQSRYLDAIVEIARREIANAEGAIPLVERDSRLGYEPSMEYMTDAAHLRWKIAQVKTVVEHEIPQYRQAVALTDRNPKISNT